MPSRRAFIRSTANFAVCLAGGSRIARAADTPGVTDTEIKVGQTMPYSGPASAYGTLGRCEAAYFKMINEQGGVNGRKITLISLDDGYSPPVTVEQTRRLIEQDEVAFIFGSLGTPTNTAIRDYLNDNKVPQPFVATGAAEFGDYKRYPWTMGFYPNFRLEGAVYAKHILATKPDARIGILYQNDDFGKDYLSGVKETLGEKAVSMVVKEASYEVSEPSVASQVITLQGSGADIFLIVASPKFAAQAFRKASDIGWKPIEYLNSTSASVGAVLKPAGLEKCVGATTAAFIKEPTDLRWTDDAGMQIWRDFMTKFFPAGDTTDASNVIAYGAARTLVQVFAQCGNDLSRDNIMREAANLKDFELPILLPGIKINTSATNHYPIRQVQLARFNGSTWELFGELLAR